MSVTYPVALIVRTQGSVTEPMAQGKTGLSPPCTLEVKHSLQHLGLIYTKKNLGTNIKYNTFGLTYNTTIEFLPIHYDMWGLTYTTTLGD